MSSTWRIVLMGVSGSGKSTIGPALAARHGARFLEGDAFHPAANIDKMAAGQPLTDEDRWPWLTALRQAMLDMREAAFELGVGAAQRGFRIDFEMTGEVHRGEHEVADFGGQRLRRTRPDLRLDLDDLLPDLL